jgi:hypothetical protein
VDGFDWSDLPDPIGFLMNPGGIWPSEVRDMTPWVINNLDLLGAELGLRLTHVATEVPLGAFRADILAEDDFGRTVVIENQFGPTDHEHFAKIVLYACEAQASVAIWISAGERWRIPAVRPEHERALTKLNEVFAGRIEFYAVAISFETDPIPLGEPLGPYLPRLRVRVSPATLAAPPTEQPML